MDSSTSEGGPMPDREAFLRRLEENNQQAEPQTQTPGAGEGAHDSILKELGSTPIDPVSLDALKEIMTPKSTNKSAVAKKLNLDDPISSQPVKPEVVMSAANDPTAESRKEAPPPPVKEVKLPARKPAARAPSELTMQRLDSMRFAAASIKTDATTAGQSADEQDINQIILDRLELQTSLIMEMDRRLTELTRMVQAQGLQQQPPMLGPEAVQRGIQAEQQFGLFGQLQQQQQQTPTGAPHPQQQQPRAAPGVNPPVLQNLQQQQQEARHEMFFTRIYKWLVGIPRRISQTKTAEVWRVFLALQRREVQLDGRRFLQVIFMVTVLSAKMMFNKRNRVDGKMWNSQAKFYLVMSIVLVGFLIQSGYIPFLYKFFVKENYPDRIYRGETIDVNAPMGPARRPPEAAQDVQQQPGEQQPAPVIRNVPRGQAANFVFAGGVPRHDNDDNQARRQRGLINNLVVNVFYLVGSFILSILPMWKVEVVEAPRPVEQEQAGQGEIGQVAPPPNLEEHAAEDSDGEDN